MAYLKALVFKLYFHVGLSKG